MAIHYPDILQERSVPRTFRYKPREVMLYALGIGLGEDPLDENELPFVYEKNLKVVPTAASVLTPRSQTAPMPEGLKTSEVNFRMILHGEQKVVLHKPLPPEATFTLEGGVVGVWDKGEGKGAVLVRESVWTDEAGEKVATLTSSLFCRGDGGFGGPTTGAPEPHAVPTRAPDLSVDYPTRRDQALLYRLNGDYNPLHADPKVARAAGFEGPILHGLCSYGITCRAILEHVLDYDSDQILSHQARFAAPVMPGETITVDIWKDGKDISFEARVKSRGVTSIRNGLTRLR